MREIKVGDYVRIEYGYIGRVVNINDFRPPENRYVVESNLFDDVIFIGITDIIKYSENILDLIENKDILKIKDLEDNSISFVGIDETTNDIKYKDIIESIENKEIELLELLTHQLFNNSSYKLIQTKTYQELLEG